jgi:hypothetical protein
MPRHEWATTTELREAAMRYAARHAWGVLPGHFHDQYGCSCGDPGCYEDTHPTRNLDAATLEPAAISRWWGGEPYPVLLPTGIRFDVLEVPGPPGREALLRLEILGYELGPIAQTGLDRILVWVQAGSRLPNPPGTVWMYETLDIRLHGAGGYVAAPPSCGTRWFNPPEATGAALPRVVDLIGTLVCACRLSQTRYLPQALPAQRRGNKLEQRPA